MINNRLVDEPGEAWCTVDLAFPLGCAGGAEEDKVLEAQHGLRLAVAFLLFAEGLQSEAPIVPNDRGRAEGDHAAALLQTPAEVHIITRLAVFRIEATHLIKCPAVECHVAAGNVLRHDIGEQYMARPSGSCSHTGLHPVFRRWRNVWSAHSGEVSAQECANKIVKPVWVCHAVAVRVNNDIPRRFIAANISGEAQAFVFLADVFNPRMPCRDFLRVIFGAVVHEDDFVVWIIDVLERGQASLERLAAIVGADDHRGFRILTQLHAGGHGAFAKEEALHGLEGRFFCSVAPH